MTWIYKRRCFIWMKRSNTSSKKHLNQCKWKSFLSKSHKTYFKFSFSGKKTWNLKLFNSLVVALISIRSNSQNSIWSSYDTIIDDRHMTSVSFIFFYFRSSIMSWWNNFWEKNFYADKPLDTRISLKCK